MKDDIDPPTNGKSTSEVKDRLRAAGAAGSQAAEELRAAGGAAAEQLRGARRAASDAMRERARYAQDWARGQWGTVQNRVESEPGKASFVALGVGLLAGLLIGAALRNR